MSAVEVSLAEDGATLVYGDPAPPVVERPRPIMWPPVPRFRDQPNDSLYELVVESLGDRGGVKLTGDRVKDSISMTLAREQFTADMKAQLPSRFAKLADEDLSMPRIARALAEQIGIDPAEIPAWTPPAIRRQFPDWNDRPYPWFRYLAKLLGLTIPEPHNGISDLVTIREGNDKAFEESLDAACAAAGPVDEDSAQARYNLIAGVASRRSAMRFQLFTERANQARSAQVWWRDELNRIRRSVHASLIVALGGALQPFTRFAIEELVIHAADQRLVYAPMAMAMTTDTPGFRVFGVDTCMMLARTADLKLAARPALEVKHLRVSIDSPHGILRRSRAGIEFERGQARDITVDVETAAILMADDALLVIDRQPEIDAAAAQEQLVREHAERGARIAELEALLTRTEGATQ